MSQPRAVRTSVLAAALAVALAASLGPAAARSASPAAVPVPASTAAPAPGSGATDPYDRAERRASAPPARTAQAPAPGDVKPGRIPGPATPAAAAHTAPAAGVPCTLDAVTALGPEPFADFLTDPAVLADGCLRALLWTWDARLAPVMSDAHVQAAARRAGALAPGHDGQNSAHLEELFTYLHAVVYHDFSRDEIDISDPPTLAAVRGAVDELGGAARTFDATAANARTLREALYTASAAGLRHHQLPLTARVLATMGPDRPATHHDTAWAGAALAGLSLNYLGLYPGNQDAAFHAAAAADPGYRAAFKGFAAHTHLKGTANAWLVRDALNEYGRFGQVAGLREAVAADLGALLEPVRTAWGDGSAPWVSLASWLNHFEACAPYGVCRADIEKRLFPHTYTYDNGGVRVRTALDRALVDKLHHASKQVKAQFHRVLGADAPLAGDPHTVLTVVLYASRADYENYHPLLTGMGTDNGGIYIERGATFYTYERRVPQDSSLTLEELFRHEYTHYLNGRFAVPGFFGEGPWYEGDRTTAMDEGTAEFFAGATRDDGVAVRRALVRGIIADTAGGGPRMSVEQILNATYDGDGFRFYDYAGTFFAYLWTSRPTLLRTMYTQLRNDDVAGYDAWRRSAGADAGIQQGYDRFLDARIAEVDDLFVPDTAYTPGHLLRHATVAGVRDAFAGATYTRPQCAGDGDPGRPRFVCAGRITARLTDGHSPDQVFRDMSETVDAFLLDRAAPAADNLADMTCSFGPVDIWPGRDGGTSDYRCEGPLRH
ncbi:collagenase [Streptomyces sp. NPDC005805]|uniref:collagenase n=1 Tax=Streptomyces sp. NPDC005805 TaxID=3157068 RepID=UPI0034039720